MLVGIASILTHLMLDISIETVAKEMLDLLHKHISPPLASASPNGKVNDSVKACRSSVSRSETGTCGHTSRSVLRPTHSALQHCMCERHLSVGERLANYKGRSTKSCGSPKKTSIPDGKDVPWQPLVQDYIEEEKPLVPGVTVRGATVQKLATLAIMCFSHESGELAEGRDEFPRVLLLMHQWFVPAEQLAEKFMELYSTVGTHAACTTPGCGHRYKLPKCGHQQYRIKVCHTIRYWIATFPMHFDLNPKLSRAIQRFLDMLESSGDPHLRQLIDISKVPSYDWMRNMSVRNPNNVHAGKQVNLLFNTLPPSELAEQLTFLEYKAFRRITFNDFKNYAIHASLKDNVKLERSIALFNGLSQWVQCMILSKTTPQQRANIIVKFVDVAKRLRQLQNYNTLMAVVGGLTHSALARLNKTNSCLPQDAQKTLMEMTELLSSSNNFSNYRRMLHQCKDFRIPILGVHLKDLVLLNTALPDKIESSLINFRKMTQLSITFTELMQVQNSSPPVEANMDLVNMIRLSLDLHYTEDEIYELSLAREPRNSLSSPSTPTKPVVFADWVAGVSPPDSNTINKHVNDMVEAVFKNYDHDKDGFISHAEFELIAGNFPFIDSFCVLDADQDGMISKSEMKTYFIRANCHALRNSFKHDFHEQTYFKPTFCIHCTGLLWGIIKQGWKCKDCSIHAHKHCKDLVVMECRPKLHPSIHSPGGRTLSLTNGGSRDVTLAAKRKMSQRQRRSHCTRGTQTDVDIEAVIARGGINQRILQRGISDRGSLDRGSFDRGSLDRGSLDRGSLDRSSFDRSSLGCRSLDRGSLDRGSVDRGSLDRGSLDQTSVDQATIDRGVLKRGSSEHGSFEHGNSKRGSLERGSSERGSFEHGTSQRGRLERGTSERGSLERSTLERGILERGTSENGILERGTMKRGSLERGTSASGILEHRTSERGSLERGTSERGSLERETSERGSLERETSEHGSLDHGTSERGSLERETSERGSFDRGNIDHMGDSLDVAGSEDIDASTSDTTKNHCILRERDHLGITRDRGSSGSGNSSGGGVSSVNSSPRMRVAYEVNNDTPVHTSTGSRMNTAGMSEAEFYEEQSALYERLLKAEEERDRVLSENQMLKSRCDMQSEQIGTLKSHLGLIRQHTVTFILDQMDTLHMQRDTEV